MATLSEYFETEVHDALAQIASLLDSELPDTAVLHRAVRALRGTAQLAREEHVFRAASALEAVTKATHAGTVEWGGELRAALQGTVADLHALVRRDGDPDAQRARAAEVEERLRGAGIAAGAAGSPPTAAFDTTREDDEFIRFAAQEVAGIAEALDRSVRELVDAPMDRDPLKAVLRRQRTLLGAARLDEIPVVAEILRAVEDLTRIVARLDVGVKQDWLDVYRVARDGLRQALEPLQRGEDPPHSNSVSRLRHMRHELVERFGSGEVVSAAHDSGLVQAQPVEEQPQPVALPVEPYAEESDEEAAPDLVAAAAGAPGGVVPVESLCYTPEEALRQALALHDVIMRATADDAEARAAADELFDLIRYALG
jgi:hypothetical protein